MLQALVVLRQSISARISKLREAEREAKSSSHARVAELEAKQSSLERELQQQQQVANRLQAEVSQGEELRERLKHDLEQARADASSEREQNAQTRTALASTKRLLDEHSHKVSQLENRLQ